MPSSMYVEEEEKACRLFLAVDISSELRNVNYFTHKYFILCTNLTQKRLDFAKLHGLPNFYPNLPIFLHGYLDIYLSYP